MRFLKSKSYMTIILAAFISFSVSADIFLKYGTVVSNHNTPHTMTWAGIWAETDNCDACIAMFALETYRGGSGIPLDRLLGVDYVLKPFNNDSGTVRVNLGFAGADKTLKGGEVFNFHFGTSMEIKRAIAGKYSLLVSYDHFSNGKTLFDRDHIAINNPLDLFSVGIGF